MRPARTNSISKIISPQPHRLVAPLLDWFAHNARDLPWRRTCDPYSIWVSEIMLQQTQVKSVIPFWECWMRELPDIQSLAVASSEKIHKLWEGLGYYTRVRNLQKAAQFIIANHGGKFPGQFDDVLALAGIGRYTAGAICSIAFYQPTPILDGNVIRVLTRVFAIAGNPREKTANARLWQLAEQLVQRASRLTSQRSSCSHLNQSLMELGALICIPRAPRCLLCPLRKHCLAFRQNRVHEFPNLGKRAAVIERRFAAFVLERQGRFLVRRRPAGVVNAHLWEFPNAELLAEKTNLPALAKRILGCAPKHFESLCVVKHSITRYRMTLEAFQVNGIPKALIALPTGRWLTRIELRKLSFPSAHRKILECLDSLPQ
ncbi:MAG: A/G-specific adenine glycosylase [Verrucomicrobiota bacterium]